MTNVEKVKGTILIDQVRMIRGNTETVFDIQWQ